MNISLTPECDLASNSEKDTTPYSLPYSTESDGLNFAPRWLLYFLEDSARFTLLKFFLRLHHQESSERLARFFPFLLGFVSGTALLLLLSLFCIPKEATQKWEIQQIVFPIIVGSGIALDGRRISYSAFMLASSLGGGSA